MIALCAQHHKKADGGAYTNEQLHGFKKDKVRASAVKGDLDWLRRDLLAVVGGCTIYNTPRLLVIDGHDVIALTRDAQGYLRLSVNLLSLSSEERIIIDKNSWENIGVPLDLRSPPQGKELEVKYAGGDSLSLRFLEIETYEDACGKYGIPHLRVEAPIKFPITCVEINLNIAGTDVGFTPKSSRLGDGNQIRGGLFTNCQIGIDIETRFKWAQNPLYKSRQAIDAYIAPNVVKVDFRRQR